MVASRRGGAGPAAGATRPTRRLPGAALRRSPTPAVTTIGLTSTRTCGWPAGRRARSPLSPLEHDLLLLSARNAGHTWPFETLHRESGATTTSAGGRRAVGGQAAAPQAARVPRLPVARSRPSAASGCGSSTAARRGVPAASAARLDAVGPLRDSRRGLLLGVRPGFARVAACTVPVAVADPAATPRRSWSRPGRATRTASRSRSSPSCRCAATPIDDLFLQDTLLAGVEEAIAEIVEGSADLLPVIVVGAPLVHGTRVLNCAVVVHRGRILGVAPEVLPADLPRVLRAPLVRARRRPARRDHHGSAGTTCRSGPT